MRTVAYMRVSSRAQDTAMQRAAIQKAAAARRDRVSDWFSEKRGGKVLGRPELDRLRAEVRAGKVAKLYVFKLDRLTRSGIRDTFEVIEECRANGCEVISVNDGFALQGPAAEVILAVIAWAAKMERLAINERIAAARERLAQEGRPWGRPPRLSTAEIARIKGLRSQGRSIREIAVALKVPRSTVARAAADRA